jgi:hypothetical protein
VAPGHLQDRVAQEESMTMPGEEHTGENALQIKRGRVDSLSLYEITDNELDILATGSPSSLHLNLAIFFLSSALAFLIALLTTKIESDRTFTIFVVILVVSSVVGCVMMLMWSRAHRSTREVIKRIRDRLPSEEFGSPGGKGRARKKVPGKGREQKSLSNLPVPEETEAEEGKQHSTGGEGESQGTE